MTAKSIRDRLAARLPLESVLALVLFVVVPGVLFWDKVWKFLVWIWRMIWR